MTENLPIEALIPVMDEAFRRGKSFRLPIRGTSMLPLIRYKVDPVTILPLDREPLEGDIVLFRFNV